MAAADEQKFSEEDIQRFEAIGRAGAEMLIKNADENVSCDGFPWKLDFEKPELNLKVYSAQAKGSSLYRFKAVIRFPGITAKEMFDFLADNPHRLEWDRNVCGLETTLIKDYSTPEKMRKTLLFHSTTEAVGPISSRDFVDLTLMESYPDSDGAQGGQAAWISAGSGLEADQCCGHYPVNSKRHVRGFNHPGSGWYFRPINGGKDAECVYSIMTDLRGWFLAVIINSAIGNSYTACIEDLRNALKKRGWAGFDQRL